MSHSGSIIKIKRTLEHIDEFEIINQCQLEYGIMMGSLNFIKKTFEFTKHSEVIELFPPHAKVESITRKTI